MKHIDLFSGIGGFALAVDYNWPGANHIFCDIDNFCQNVLRSHWPESKVYGDIEQLITDTTDGRLWESQKAEDEKGHAKKSGKDWKLERGSKGSHSTATDTKDKRKKGLSVERKQKQENTNARYPSGTVDLVTGGFPCQPFSQAGLRKGTEDDRYLWPKMFRVIQLTKPTWVIAENVRGLVSWNDGMVLEQVCTDLESQGYEVQPFIIPAVALNAPHRRDRIWIIANRQGERDRGSTSKKRRIQERIVEQKKQKGNQTRGESKGRTGNNTDTNLSGLQERTSDYFTRLQSALGNYRKQQSKKGWSADWTKIAAELCRVDDGFSKRVVKLSDGTEISSSKWRQEAIKAYGNAIVPQVAIQIMQSIKSCQNLK